MANYSIHVKNFSKTFGDLKAVDNLSFDVNEGEIFAFLGSNGSGKTTTIRCLLKIYQPDFGELLINDQEYTEKLNDKIGYLPEERGLYKDVSVLDILVYTAQLRGIDRVDAKKRSLEYLTNVDLLDHKDKMIAQLSSGMQQKVQLGTALIHNPEILILDEPFKGLDPVNRQLFVDILLERAKNGTTILYSTHVIDEAQKMADSLLIIKDGIRLEYGSINDVRKRYGSNNLVIEFTGKPPDKETKLYTSVISNKTAEIVPKDDKIDSNIIISDILQNGTKLVSMKLDYPSLNQIFINLMKKK
ncbi:MAG: ABC transporter ATP-binding protein [Candidatus Dojkabacteria bacterium]